MATLLTLPTARGRRRCDATCHRATRPLCACICGGAYHGCARQGYVVRSVVDAELARQGLDPQAVPAAMKQTLAQRLALALAERASRLLVTTPARRRPRHG